MCTPSCPAKHESLAPEEVPRQGVDYAQLAADVDTFREVVSAIVAGLISDGFTDRQARALVTGVIGKGFDPKEDQG